MIIDHPRHAHVPQLRRLWQQAFGDTDAFLDSFFTLGFHPQRCLCALENRQPIAALYWFDCDCRGQKMAYLYAVATDTAYQGRGICRTLMAHTHELLHAQGYSAALLVPGQESLFAFYGSMGYHAFGGVEKWQTAAGAPAVKLQPVTAEEYAARRRQLLPEGGVTQEGALLSVLADQLNLYAGDGFLLSAAVDADRLLVQEFLGDRAAASGVLTALGLPTGLFRAPGGKTPMAMGLSLDGTPLPTYFGLPLD